MDNVLSTLHWPEIVYFLQQGSPPVGTQLLIANGVLLLVWTLRRMRGDKRFNERTGMAMTILLLVSNFYILVAGEAAFH